MLYKEQAKQAIENIISKKFGFKFPKWKKKKRDRSRSKRKKEGKAKKKQDAKKEDKKKDKEVRNALFQAKRITKENDKLDTPVTKLLGILKGMVKLKKRVLQFKAFPKKIKGLYRIVMKVNPEYEVSKNYSDNIGFALGTGHLVLEKITKGHTFRHLQEPSYENKQIFVEKKGSFAEQLSHFMKIATPILESPDRTFNKMVNKNSAKGFAKKLKGLSGISEWVIVYVVKEGSRAGEILTSVVPKKNQQALLGLY